MEKINIEDIELYNKLSDKIFEVAKETFNYIMEKYPYLLQGDEPELYDFYLTNDKLVIIYNDIENDDDNDHYWECPLTHVIEGTTIQYVDNWVVEEKNRREREAQQRRERERLLREKREYDMYIKLKAKYEK